jgi:hypothetical protein
LKLLMKSSVRATKNTMNLSSGQKAQCTNEYSSGLSY